MRVTDSPEQTTKAVEQTTKAAKPLTDAERRVADAEQQAAEQHVTGAEQGKATEGRRGAGHGNGAGASQGEPRTLRSAFPPALLLSLAALAAVAPLGTDTYLPAFTAMARDLHVGASEVQLTMTAFLVGIAIGQLTIGVLSDRVGRRPLLLWGTVLSLVAGIATVVAPNITVLIIARFLQGLGGASGMVLGRAVIADRARGAAAAQALNLVMAIQGIAPVLAPILGGILVGPIGWRGILAVVAAFTAILLLLIIFCVPETLPAERRNTAGLRSLLAGAKELSKSRFFVRIVLINAATFSLLMAYLSATPFVLQSVLGMSTGQYTIIFGCCAATMTVATTISSALINRWAPERQIRTALASVLVVDTAMAAVCLATMREPVDSTPLRIAIPALLMCHVFCLGFAFGNIPAIALAVAGRRAGTGSAILGFVQFVCGGLVSPLVGLAGEDSATGFAVVLITVAILVNILALPGVRAPELESAQKAAVAEVIRDGRQGKS